MWPPLSVTREEAQGERGRRPHPAHYREAPLLEERGKRLLPGRGRIRTEHCICYAEDCASGKVYVAMLLYYMELWYIRKRQYKVRERLVRGGWWLVGDGEA